MENTHVNNLSCNYRLQMPRWIEVLQEDFSDAVLDRSQSTIDDNALIYIVIRSMGRSISSRPSLIESPNYLLSGDEGIEANELREFLEAERTSLDNTVNSNIHEFHSKFTNHIKKRFIEN